MSEGSFRRHALAAALGLGVIVVVVLLPDLTSTAGTGGPPVEAYGGRIESVEVPPADPDPSLVPVRMAEVRLLDGPRAGDVVVAFLSGPGGSLSDASYRPGDEVVVTFTPAEAGGDPIVSVADRWRIPPLQILVLVFAAAIVLVGGWQGVRALIALGLTIAVVLKILLPLVIEGVPPVPLAVITASAVTVAAILLTEGWKRSSVSAILGTAGALAITGLLAAGATAAMGFSYTAGSDLAFLTTSTGEGLDLRGVLLAAFILGAVGVLDDVTVTQAVLVEELADRGGLRGSLLFASAMGIGRSHIAATVNTLFLAYVGAGLPLLVLLLVSRQPTALVLNDELIAVEIVRTLVGGLGIVAAVPLTTFIAVSLIAPVGDGGAASARTRLRTAVVAGSIVAALLVATALLPLSSEPRQALAPDVFEPGEPGASADPLDASPAVPPGPPAREPAIVDVGDVVPITLDGIDVGTITVFDLDIAAPQPPGTEAVISVTVRYEAATTFDLGLGSWTILLADGTERDLIATDDPSALDRSLGAGEHIDVALMAAFVPDTDAPIIVYSDVATASIIFAVPAE